MLFNEAMSSSWAIPLTSEEVHEISCDVAVGTDDAAVPRWSWRTGGTGWALNGSHIGFRIAIDTIFLQQPLIYAGRSILFNDTVI